MDTIHDFGGRQGYGPIRWQDDDDAKPFHEPWQARVWALSMTMNGKFNQQQTGWTLDWCRHVIERIPPEQYLSLNYFDKWNQYMMATLIDDGSADLQEFVDGKSHRATGTPTRKELATTEAGAPRFAIGSSVLTKRHVGSLHTRLPGYARGCNGIIDSIIGAAPLADAKAIGEIRNEPLYVVRFEASELWPEAAGARHAVYIDLWESYLDPA